MINENNIREIMDKAVKYGIIEMNKCTPIPMIVEQHTNMLDDKSPVSDRYFVRGGVCGFVQIKFKANTSENRRFLNNLKKANLVGEFNMWSKSYTGGYIYYVHVGGQSLQLKEAFADGFVKYLREYYNIKLFIQSRMD